MEPDRLALVLISMGVTALIMLGVFYVCFPQQMALMGNALMCHAEYIRHTS